MNIKRVHNFTLPAHIDTWVFDLDNTLYPAHCDLFASMDIRMSEYIADLLDLDILAAKAIQNKYYLKYGTTLDGLMKHHDAEPMPFLDFVHDVDLSPLDSVRDIDPVLRQISGRKLVFTNGSQKHAKNITGYMGISHHFEAMYGVDDAGYVPKPQTQTYETFCAKHNINPNTAVFFEDSALNLKPAKAMGFTTVLISETNTKQPDWVDYLTPCLPRFLEANTAF